MRKENFTNKRWTKLLAFVLAALTAFAVFPIMAVEKAAAAETTSITFSLTVNDVYFEIGDDFYCGLDTSGQFDSSSSSEVTIGSGSRSDKYTVSEDESQKTVKLTDDNTTTSQPFTFTVSNETKELVKITATAGGEQVPLNADNTDVIVTSNTRQNLTIAKADANGKEITISASVVQPTYNVHFPDDNDKYTVDTEGHYTVEKGNKFSFSVLVNPGDKPTVNYRMGTTGGKATALEAKEAHSVDETTQKWKYKFEFPEATGDINVSSIVVVTTTVKVTVTGLNDSENHFEHNLTGRNEDGKLVKDIPYGSDFSFNLSPYPGYQAPLITVSEPSSALVTRVGTLYTVANVTEDITINIGEPKAEEYTVTFPLNGTGFTATAAVKDGDPAGEGNVLKVENGKTVTLTVNVEDGYTQSKPTVKANEVDQTVNKGDGNSYTCDILISRDTNITVTGLKLNTYTVTYTPAEGATTEFSTTLSTQNVTHGQSVQFTVTPNEGYNAPSVDVDSVPKNLTVAGNNYTLSNITGNVTVTITPNGLKTFKVTTHQDKTYSIEVTDDEGPVKDTVKYGTTVTIKVTPTEAYNNSTVNVNIGGTVVRMINDGNNVWTGTHRVTSDIDIVVSGLSQNTYTVTLPQNTTKYEVTASQSTVVNHNASFVFTITLKPGYKYSGENKNIVSGLDGVSYDVRNDGDIYTVTIENVTKNINGITVTSEIQSITYSIEWPKDTQHYSLGGNSSTVNYGNHGLTFTVDPENGYKVENVSYTVNGVTNTLNATRGDSYTLPVITADVKVTISVTPIVVTVQYAYENITMTNQVLYSAGSVSREYSIDSRDGHVLNVEDGKLTLTLPDLKQDDFVAEKWMSDNATATVAGNKLEITGDLNSDRVVIVKANWKVDTTLVEETVKFGAVTPKTEATEKAVVGTWETTFQLSTDPRIAEILNRGTVTGFGFIYSKSDFNSKLDDSDFADWLGGISSTTDKDGVYATFNSVNNDPFVNGMVFRQRMSFNKGQDMPKVWGAFYVRVNVAGTTYVIVSGTAMIDFGSAAGQIALPTKVGED